VGDEAEADEEEEGAVRGAQRESSVPRAMASKEEGKLQGENQDDYSRPPTPAIIP